MTSRTRPPRPGPHTTTGQTDIAAEQTTGVTTEQTAERAGPPRPSRRLGLVVTASLTTGVALSVALALSPVVPAHEERVRGAVLLGFAAGWTLIAALSSRLTSTPQRWASVLAAFMAAGGALLLTFGATVQPAVDWVWPPAALLLTVWATPSARRVPSPTGRRLLLCVLALLALASVGGGYQTIGETVDARRQLSMPGQLIDVGDHRLHLTCTGSGSPTVVLEPGAGEMAANLGWIAPAVARTTRTCVYDRAGRGWSDATDSPQNGARVADDLHTLLRRAGVPGPYVLAGHSFGGLYVMAFAARYPDEVAGMVLIDSTAPATKRAPVAAQSTGSGTLDRVSALLSTTSRVGVSRLYARLATGDLPASARGDVRASVATASTVNSTVEEYLSGGASARDAAALQDFGDKPLMVLTAGEGHPGGWFTAQDRLARLSTRAVHRVVEGAAHEDLVGEAQYATVTARAIVDVVTTVRNGR